MHILNINELQHQELKAKSSGEKLSFSALISPTFGFKDLFIHHEILPPGRKSSSPHSHTKKEEMAFIITGNPTVHIGNDSHKLKPGDLIGFKPLTEAHYFENLTTTEVELIIISSNPFDDVINY